MGKLHLWIGLSFALLAWMAAVMMGPKPLVFINLPSLIIGFGVPLGLMIAKYGREAFWMRGLIVSKKNQILDEWDRVIFYAAYGAVIIGMVQMLSNMADPRHIGPAIALCLPTLFQAIMIRLFVIFPLKVVEAKK